MDTHRPGPDERGNYWLDCGCMVNRIMQRRCPLHHTAPDLLKHLKRAVFYLREAATFADGMPGSNAGMWDRAAREAEVVIAQAEVT